LAPDSEDVMDQELPLVKSRAFGGTLMLCLKELDPFKEVIPTNTAAFLPVIVKMPGLMTTVHITLDMPNSGKDSEFVSDLAKLRNCIDILNERFTNPILYMRGDANVNANNTTRVILLRQLMNDYNLIRTETGHFTYHHFVGEGL
jgi:hypothetical protein